MTRKLLIQRLKAIIGANDGEPLGWDIAFDDKYKPPECCIADQIVYHRNELRREQRKELDTLIQEL